MNVVERIMDATAAHADRTVDRIMDVLVGTIPAYSALDPGVLASIRQTIRTYLDVATVLIREGRPPTKAEMEWFGRSARRRIHQGLPLEVILQALRVGFAETWEVIREEMSAEEELRDFDAVLEIGTALLHHIDQAATVVTQHCLDEQEHLAASADRRHRQLIADVLRETAGGHWVVVLTPPGSPAALARTLRDLPLPVLAAPETDTVLALWPDDFASLERAFRALNAAHGPLSATAAKGLPEARLIRAVAPAEGLVRLEDVLLDALIHQLGGRVAEAVRAVAEPLGSQLRETVAAYVEADMSVRETARLLHIHRNSVHYRLGQITRLTGRDPRRSRDLFLLHAALR